MRFESYIVENTDDKKRFKEYLKTNGMLKASVSVLNDITKKGYKAYIVGGSVRDIILGHNPHDVDIATNMPMDELEDMYKTYDIGKSKDFGIVVVNVDGHQFEIAQFRQDGKYVDGRRPEEVTITQDFKGDASRRDFSFNAMAIDAEGNIIDYFDGKKALKNKVVQTVGNPSDRFKEDYLRMLRAARFAGKLGFDIEPKTKEAIKANKDNIKKMSVERIKDELWKMASQSGDKFANTIRILDDVGILEIILPELMKLKDFKENPIHHPEAFEDGQGTPFDHTMKALRKNKLEDPLVNLAILFHDIGKGATYGTKDDGSSTFYNHGNEALDIIDTLAKRLKFSNKEKDAIIFAAVNHMKLFKGHEMKPSKIIKLVKDRNWEVLKAVSYCDDSCRTGLFDKKKFKSVIDNMEKIAKKWGDKTAGTMVKVVDGNRVLKLTKIRPSKMVGDIIKKVTDIAMKKNIKSDKELDKLILKVYGEMK
jgi:tRNA nucleotidyltransferase/poly(A) polymerase